MNRLIIADIKSPVIRGKCMGHFPALARDYYMIFRRQVKTLIAGGPVFVDYFSREWLMRLPYNLYLIEETTLVQKCKYFVNAWHLFRNCVGDVIIVQQGADVSFFIACALLYRRFRYNRLYLIQYSTASIDGRLQRMIYSLAMRKLNGIICPNDEVGQAFNIPYCVVPDYIYVQEEYECVSYERRKYDICMIGHIAEEKGIVEFLERFAETSYKMIIAGLPHDENIASKLTALSKSNKNITLRLGFLSDEEYKNYLLHSRFGVLNYKGEYSKRSSGVVLDMLFNDVPIIGLDCKALDFVKKNKLGYIYKDLDAIDLSEIITQDRYRTYVDNISCYKKTHAKYSRKLSEFLKITNTNK